jgi:zinc protease
MIKILITITLLGQLIMAALLENIEVNRMQIPLIFEQDSSLPIVSLKLVFQTSGSSQDENRSGLAKLSAKMMGEGTQKRGAIGFANELDSRAIHLSADAGVETFTFDLDSLKEQYSSAVDLFAELLESPNLNKESLEKVKQITLGSISRKENDYDYVASAALKKIMFAGTDLQEPQLGTAKSVSKIKLEDVKEFLNTHMTLSNVIVVIGGDLSLEEAQSSAEKLVRKLKIGKSKPLNYVDVSSKEHEQIIKKKTEQAYIYFGSQYNMKVEDEENYKARVSMFILGSSGFGSRLMEEIRVKRGLAYSAYCYTNITKSSSTFQGHMQTKIDSLLEAKSVTQSVIREFIENGVTQTELDQAKKYLLGSEPLRVETLSQRLGRTFNEFYSGRGLGSSVEDLKKIEALTLDELNAFIKSHDEILNLAFAIVTQ